MKIVSSKKPFNGESKMLPAGEHKVTIAEVKEALAKEGKSWSDQTPQLQVLFKAPDGRFITHWYMLKGYMRKEDYPGGKAPKGVEFRSSEHGKEEYAVTIATGKRIESEERTNKCSEILGNLAQEAGIPAGTEIDSVQEFAKEVVGLKIGIHVQENNGNLRVQYTMPAHKVEVATED